jgi:hypothetical protein
VPARARAIALSSKGTGPRCCFDIRHACIISVEPVPEAKVNIGLRSAVGPRRMNGMQLHDTVILVLPVFMHITI